MGVEAAGGGEADGGGDEFASERELSSDRLMLFFARSRRLLIILIQ